MEEKGRQMKAKEVRNELEALFQGKSGKFRKALEPKRKLPDGREYFLVGIEGMCASGKTTLSRELSEKYGCTVFHMDDFFLRPEQRTKERLAQIGGNVDYERFWEEVLQPLLKGAPFSYRPYNCHTGKLEEAVWAKPGRWNIIEGAYCLHPYFGDIYDYAFFMDIEKEEQKRRILERNKEELYERFVSEWIPKENAYFKMLCREGRKPLAGLSDMEI